METNFRGLIRILSEAGVAFIVVGGAAERPKDFEAIAELEAILEERQQADNQNLKANS